MKIELVTSELTPAEASTPLARRPIALLVTVIAVTVVPAAPTMFTPAPPKFWNVTPFNALPLAVLLNHRPLTPAPAALPSRVSWLLPTTESGTVTVGRAEVRLIVAGAL